MRYITLGQDDKELSEIVLGMMRIEDKSVKEVEELVEETAEATEEVHSDYDLDEMI